MSVLVRSELEQSPLADLHALASELGIEGFRGMRREALIDAILAVGGGEAPEEEPVTPDEAGRAHTGVEAAAGPEAEELEEAEQAAAEEFQAREAGIAEDEELAEAEPRPERGVPREDEEEDRRSGVLDVLPNGSGFMRVEPFVHSPGDVYVSPAQIRRCELRAGDELSGPVRPPRRSERYPSLVRIDTVNGGPAEPPEERPGFEQLTAMFATKRLPAPERVAGAPFGRGSRVAVAGEPGTGATTLLREIVAKLDVEAPDIELTVVLAGVRPEEVTEWRRQGRVTVAGGGVDRPADELAQVAGMAVERAKRTAERGGHAAIVIDSLEGLPTGAARRVFGAARATEEAGTLTVVAATGLAPEPRRLATTRILLEGAGGLAPGSGTLRAELLG